MIAALFVATGGCYFGLPDVDPWDEKRDARLYPGPHSVVAHPDCARWGRYWSGGPNPQARRRQLGDDGGCFKFALWAVRRYGGVLEHPADSRAWPYFALRQPRRDGLWIQSDGFGGWSAYVEQGAYGHRARKGTWLYKVGGQFPPMRRCTARLERLDEGFHSKQERAEARAAGQLPIRRLSNRENIATPPEFRDLLISIARTAQARAA